MASTCGLGPHDRRGHIGYGLLRLADPRLIPSVLMLDGLRSRRSIVLSLEFHLPADAAMPRLTSRAAVLRLWLALALLLAAGLGLMLLSKNLRLLFHVLVSQRP